MFLVTCLMIAPDEVHVLGMLNLKRQQQADGLQAVRAPVHVIAQEQVVDVRDVAGGAGGAILLKEPHEVAKLAVQVAEDLDRR